MRIVKVEPGKVPYEKEMEDTLENIQAEVGGYFEVMQLSGIDEDLCLCCNEDSKIIGMEMNRRVGSDIICGPFFVVGEGEDGEFRSLTDEEAEYVKDRFQEIPKFKPNEPAAKPRAMFIFGGDL